MTSDDAGKEFRKAAGSGAEALLEGWADRVGALAVELREAFAAFSDPERTGCAPDAVWQLLRFEWSDSDPHAYGYPVSTAGEVAEGVGGLDLSAFVEAGESLPDPAPLIRLIEAAVREAARAALATPEFKSLRKAPGWSIELGHHDGDPAVLLSDGD